MPKKDNEITKLYYSISEVAEMYSVSNSLIRFWESEFDILKPKKNRRGDRRFTEKDISQLKVIYNLVKERGFTLEGAKKEIKSKKERLSKQANTIESLKGIRGFLQELRDGTEQQQ